jgi:hypothetical protein
LELKADGDPVSQYKCSAEGGDVFAAGRYCHLEAEQQLKRTSWVLKDALELEALQGACRTALRAGAPEAGPALSKISALLSGPQGASIKALLANRTTIESAQKADKKLETCRMRRQYCEEGCWRVSFGHRAKDAYCMDRCNAENVVCLDAR